MPTHTIPAAQPFLPTLAQWLLGQYPQPFTLATVHVWLPTQRAVNALRRQLLAHGVTLLPRLGILGPSNLPTAKLLEGEEEEPTNDAALWVSAWRQLHPRSSPSVVVQQALQKSALTQRLFQNNLTLDDLTKAAQPSYSTYWQPQVQAHQQAYQQVQQRGGGTAWAAQLAGWQALTHQLATSTTPQIFAGFADTTPLGLTALQAGLQNPTNHLIVPDWHPYLTPTDLPNPLLHHLSIDTQTITPITGPTLTPQLTRLEAPHPFAEAQAITQHINTLPTTDSIAIVVTNRQLAQRIAESLRTAGHNVADSVGVPVPETPAGKLLHALLSAAADPTAVTLAALFAHPTVAQHLPLPASTFHGITPQHLAGWQQHLQQLGHPPTLPFFDWLAQPPSTAWLTHGLTTYFPTWLTLWGSTAVTTWLTQLGNIPLQRADWLALTLTQLTTLRVPVPNASPRIQLWGPLEARLQSPQHLIIAGCNDTNWPFLTDHPLLSNTQLQRLGLPDVAQRTQLAHHDWRQLLAAAPHLLLTRSTAGPDGTLTLPSRWWHDISGPISPYHPPINTPTITLHHAAFPLPADALPGHFSPSFMARTMACPYAAVAERLLKLTPPDPFHMAPDQAAAGDIVHAWVAAFWRPQHAPDFFDWPPPWHGPLTAADTEAALQTWRAIAQHSLSLQPALVHALWQPRIPIMGRALITEWVKDNTQHRTITHTEATLQAHGWRARADRIDTQPDGSTVIVDYKTGGVPSWANVKLGLFPQLTLEAHLWQTMHPHQPVSAVEYWQLQGHGHSPVTRKIMAGDDLQTTITAAASGAAHVRHTLTTSQHWPATPHNGSAGLVPTGHCEKCTLAGICRLTQYQGASA